MTRARASGLLPAIFISNLVREAEAAGVAKATLLREAGLDAATIAAPERQVPVEHVYAAWAAAMRLVRDDGLPITVARRFVLEDHPLLGFAALTAGTVREALARVTRFSRLVSTAGRWSLEEDDDVARVRWTREGARTLGLRVANESALAELLHGLRQTLGREVATLTVSFRHAAPASTRAHRAHFGGRLRWQAAHDELAFPRPLLDATPQLANPAMAAHFERQALAALAVREGADGSLRERTRRIIGEDLLGGEPSSVQAARRLAVSERSLRRGLAAEGTSFRELVEEVRRERAHALLADPRRSVAEVALSLGFSELSAFSRAYKRWTGEAPSRGRSALRTSSPG